MLRRTQSQTVPNDPDTETYQFNDWTLSVGRRELSEPNGVIIPISAAEFRLLTVFVKRPGMVLSRDQLLDLTAGREAKAFDRAIDNQISRLRKKIEHDPNTPSLIKTVRGGGYVFVSRVEKLGN